MNHPSLFLSALITLSLSPISHAELDFTQPTTDFSKPEKHEQFPGGKTTHNKRFDKNTFSHAAANLPFQQRIDFKIGNGLFKRLWVSAPASTQAADGLGPLYNARSCLRCHVKNGRGHPPTGKKGDNAASLILRLSIPPQNATDQKNLEEGKTKFISEPTYGAQLQNFAIQGHKAEGSINIDYEEIPIELADGKTAYLRKPQYSINNLNYGPLHAEILMSPRVAPPMIGLGLLEAIKAEDLLAKADPEDKNQDGISGKPNWVWSREDKKIGLGRYGWKAGSVSVNEQSQSAFSGDLGLSVPLYPYGAGDCTPQQTDCITAISGNSPQYENLESGKKVTDLVVFYTRNLAVPARRKVADPTVLAGKKQFYDIGCIQCHTPKYITRKDTIGPQQAEQHIWPYTDLLLHDMGHALADDRPEGNASGQEWRTPPLWSVGLTPTVGGHSNYLHDGRARSLLEAILWHGGEAQKHRDAVTRLSTIDREALLAFVASL